MKRPASVASPDSRGASPSSKRMKSEDVVSSVLSPHRRAFLRACKFKVGEKSIGFYGGWPYVAKVQAVIPVAMSFGTTYALLLRWNGFSGKKATSWVSEFDVIKHDDAGTMMKAKVCSRYFVPTR
jgi:hypothetical protein